MMPFKFAPLITDGLIYLLVLISVAFGFQIRRREHLLAPWRRVGHSRSGMTAATVLAAYLAVGLLDSMHYRPVLEGNNAKSAYATEVVSVFDKLCSQLRSRTEETYSAPFSSHLFSKETVTRPDGTQGRDYPRLKFGGAHLRDPEREAAGDIVLTTLTGLLAGAISWSLFAALAAIGLARRWRMATKDAWSQIWKGETAVAWREVLITAAVIAALAFPAMLLSVKYHIFGTDKVGQDVFYLSLKSIRTGLVIGTLTTLVMLPFALLFGIMAGYFRGWIDDAIQYTYTTLSSIPDVLLIAAAVLMTQVYMDSHPHQFPTVTERADFRLLFLCFILGITSWTGLCRLLRGEALKLREMEYIQAAHAFGVSHWRIMSRHILPNVMHIVLITMVLSFSGLVLAEAVLSYIGVGVDPSMISFGTMINGARLELAREPVVWWSLMAAFAFMFVLVLFANLFADAVRDALDPRTRVFRAVVKSKPAA